MVCLSENCRHILLRKNDCEVPARARVPLGEGGRLGEQEVARCAFTRTRPAGMLGANIEGAQHIENQATYKC